MSKKKQRVRDTMLGILDYRVIPPILILLVVLFVGLVGQIQIAVAALFLLLAVWFLYIARRMMYTGFYRFCNALYLDKEKGGKKND